MVELLSAAEYGRVYFGKERMTTSTSREGCERPGLFWKLGYTRNYEFQEIRTLRTDQLASMYRIPFGVYKQSLPKVDRELDTREFHCIREARAELRGPRACNSARSRSRRKAEARGGRTGGCRPTLMIPEAARVHLSTRTSSSSSRRLYFNLYDVSRVKPSYFLFTLIKF